MSSSSGKMSDDSLILGIVGVLAAPTLLGVLVVFWEQCVAWAVTAGVLLPSAVEPLVVLPQAGGAGLDLPRMFVVFGLAVAVLLLVVVSARAAWLRRREIR